MNNELEEIFAYIDYIRSQTRLVSIVYVFKGVSFTLSVNIIAVSKQEEIITVMTPPRQNMSLLPNVEVTIHSDLFPHPILAFVTNVDVSRRTAVLTPCEYQRSLDDNRMEARVQVNKNIPVTMFTESNDKYMGEIHDLSIKGMSILWKGNTDEADHPFQTGNTFSLGFQLDISDLPSMQTLQFQGKVIYTMPMDEGRLRIGLQTYPTPRDISTLRRYIFDRQTEFFRGAAAPTDTTFIT